MNRREFLRRTGAAVAAGSAAGGLLAGCGQTEQTPAASMATHTPPAPASRIACILFDPADPVASAAPAQWAIGQLRAALAARELDPRICHKLDEVPTGAACVLAAGGSTGWAREVLDRQNLAAPDAPEALALAPGFVAGQAVLLAGGRDARGLAYALTEVADAVTYAADPRAALMPTRAVIQRPANSVRGAMRLFCSDVEDKPWYNDHTFWQRYLTMLVTERFNRFNLALGLGYDFPSGIRDAYFYFAYPFLLNVPGYNVRVSELPDAERNRNLEMLRFISDQAAARGLNFQLGIWTHAYKWTDSPHANYTIEGLGRDMHSAYCRDALAALLRECPNISGVTFRIHGESGVAEGSYDFWKMVFDGVVRCGRPVGIDMHAKGMDQRMIDLALATGMPITIAPKFWAEHMGLPYHQAWIRPTELPRASGADRGFFSRSSGARSFLRYGYGDLLREDRKYAVLYRMWPGTQRLLLWGDPAMAAAYGRAAQFCGGVGLEMFEPLSFKGRKGSGLPGGRDAYADPSLKPWAGDWEKFAYGYRLWGRLTYDPNESPEVWRRGLRADFGRAADSIETSLASASRILPLLTTAHLPSAANNNFWPEIYTNMPIVDARRPHPYGDTPLPRRFGAVSPVDPQLFSTIQEYAHELLARESSGKYSPAEVAQWLLEMAEAASRPLNAIAAGGSHDADARRIMSDVTILSGLGQFFGWKLRAGIFFELFNATGDSAILDQALAAYGMARDAWVGLSAQGGCTYAQDITFGWDKHLRGNWANRIGAIDQDIADMRSVRNRRPTTAAAIRGGNRDLILRVMEEVTSPRPRLEVQVTHAPPRAFARRRELPIDLSTPGSRSVAAQLFYRHVNQAEPWQVQAMTSTAESHRGFIPADYTDSPYPLQYYVELRDGPAQAALFPGLGPLLMDQPYFVIPSKAE